MAVKMFIHGLESSNQGTKSIFFRNKYPDMIIPNFRGDLHERMKKLHGILADKFQISLVGSSFGGLMASIFAMENEPRVEKLILLAPAINSPDFKDYHKKEISVPVWIYHGKEDEIISLADVEPIAKKVFRNLSLHVVDDDHSLHKTFKLMAWDELL